MSSDTPQVLADEVLTALRYRIGKDPSVATSHDWLTAAIQVVRDRVIDRWIEGTKEAYDDDAKRVYYLSAEFLIGRLTRDAFSNLGLLDQMRQALASLGVDLDLIAELEPDAALGNGGLGRLAACFMESLATVGVPAHGYGIRYVNGMFRQEIAGGQQVELPETWLEHGNPWEFERRERTFEVGFGGTSVPAPDQPAGAVDARLPHVWMPAERVAAVAYDTPVVGWRGARVNTLRLWAAFAVDPILLDRFNAGDHVGALADSARAESLSRVLYPADSHRAGQELRLRQEHFWVSASLQDILQRHVSQYAELEQPLAILGTKAAIHLNDTHPAIAVAELLRLLVDEHRMPFAQAWDVTRETFAYTNHTLLPEALESWPIELFERLLPRHLQLIFAVNELVLDDARANTAGDAEAVRRISLIGEDGDRRVRMGNLAFVGSHSVNGVSGLHTDLMRATVFADLHQMYPQRINNKTNGVTPRRWLFQCNPGLTDLIREAIGPRFLDDFDALGELDPCADDPAFQERFTAVKLANKRRLATLVNDRLHMAIDPHALFDVQVKRIHEYKRQLLNIAHAVDLYHRILDQPGAGWTPRVKLLAGKAAPSYHAAKQIIRLANDVAETINGDPRVAGLLKVVFVPNYNVSAAEVIIPAADLSEQISTAGMEASGTGNMKFALNGALTIGTLDGANVEMRDHIGAEHMVIFGLTAAEVATRKAEGYDPAAAIEASPALTRALGSIAAGMFSVGEPERYRGLVDGIYTSDWFMVAADFDAYVAAQADVEQRWADPAGWAAAAIHNTARMAWFSSDRTIREYAQHIWNVPSGLDTPPGGGTRPP
ncbi:MAG TPA: glycogen/starch/alpha-glucan phosphorylase [Ilumatobacter sp.]|nr:glycogen/starch/alpha-glucan phosphorylase [Ilumatobacter sp.]